MIEFCFIVVMLSLNKFLTIYFNKQTLHKIWSFPLKISSVNVSKSAIYCGFDHIYWRNPQWKTSFFVHKKKVARALDICLDYSDLQGKRNISKSYMMIAWGHWFPVYGLGNERAKRYFLQEKDALTEILLGWKKVSGCQTKPMSATFLATWFHFFLNIQLPRQLSHVGVS